jgi:arsenical pump membrane protein
MRDVAVWAISGVTILAIVARPLRLAEWIWPAAGALVLVGTGLLSGRSAAEAVADGAQVYAFLIGMLALAELARVYGIIDVAVRRLSERMHGRSARLFAAFFLIAVAVTALLSNDGTIVLLTPAAIALSSAARLRALPLAFTVAFVANAASFVLPISNPANLLVFSRLPQLGPWLMVFIAPSAAAIACTYGVLRLAHAGDLRVVYAATRPEPLGPQQRVVAASVAVALAIVVIAAAFGWPVGYVALAVAAVSIALCGGRDRAAARTVAREAPWTVVPLVAGLFVIVRALDATGALELARTLLRNASAMPGILGRLYAGGVTTLGDALLNNLPVGVIARYAIAGRGISSHVAHAVLVGVDLGPNLSITGSLATLLWLMLLRREGIEVNGWRFLALGALVTIPSLALALAVLR